ncbi:MAG TPA: helix-turn-helix domain-containing protein [Jatrophihabitans sp.]|nr:helix-turn-helix domain-containing protein [Jatrophihabitans sp.]
MTRTRILDAAQRLVIENGFAATSVDQVITESGTSKGAFFHHFSSKLDLAQSLVDRYAAADIAHLDEAVAHAAAQTDDPARQVIEFVRFFEDGADELMSAQSSCLYVSILTERQLADSGTATQIGRAIVAWRTALARMLHDALAQLPAAPAVDPDALADHVFVTFEGAFILCRSTSDSTHMRAQLTALRQLLEALLIPKVTRPARDRRPRRAAPPGRRQH